MKNIKIDITKLLDGTVDIDTAMKIIKEEVEIAVEIALQEKKNSEKEKRIADLRTKAIDALIDYTLAIAEADGIETPGEIKSILRKDLEKEVICIEKGSQSEMAQKAIKDYIENL